MTLKREVRIMVRDADNKVHDPALNLFPDDLSDSTINEIEFMLPITSIDEEPTSEAPLLDALTRYRNNQ